MLLHGLEGGFNVKQTRGDPDRFTPECWWGSKEKATVYQLPGAVSLHFVIRFVS